jgi:hypothetical protein
MMTVDPNAANELGKLLNAEPVKQLLSPASHEIGGLLGDIANMARFYATRNLEKIFTKWAHSRRKGKVIEAGEFERVMPLLPSASMQSDGELQDRWAALLESAAIADIGYLPSFGQTLSQLTAEEAKFLDRLWAYVTRPRPVHFPPLKVEVIYPPHLAQDQSRDSSPPSLTGMEPLEEVEIISIFDSSIEVAASFYRGMQFKDEFSPQLPHARLVIVDLVRLGVIEREPVVDPASGYSLDQDTMLVSGETHLYFQYSLTQYGVSFIRSVSPSGDHDGKRGNSTVARTQLDP